MVELTLEKKKEKVEQLKGLLEEYPVVGMLDMHGLPAKQLQEIKKELQGIAEIKMTRRTLIQRALEKSDKQNLSELEKVHSLQPALIFSNEGAFKLFKKIKAKKTSAPAKAGAIASSDIKIDEGPTGIPPGPMIGKIQTLGAQTKVEDGEIVVQSGSVAVEEGETISEEEADILNNMGMEPLEVGLDLKSVWSDGVVYTKKVLDIDTEEYRDRIASASQQAFNLALEAGYPTSETVVPMIQDAFNKAKNLLVNGEIPTRDSIDDLLKSAVSKAKALESQVEEDGE